MKQILSKEERWNLNWSRTRASAEGYFQIQRPIPTLRRNITSKKPSSKCPRQLRTHSRLLKEHTTTCCVTSSKVNVSQPQRSTPRSIYDVSNNNILGFGANLSQDHPGFNDLSYKARRAWISELASAHKIGMPIPRIAYNQEELQVWKTVLQELRDLLPQHACKQYLQAAPLFNFTPNQIPQLQDVNEVLNRATGWSIRPAAGLLHPRDFLAGLAFKTFHSTQYIRHPSSPSYTPEPDLVHELIGHVPLLADAAFADMLQTLGEASLGVDDKQIWHLIKVYWYTVEFGVVREGSCVKAFGAGILSSFGELQHMSKGTAQFETLDPFIAQPKMSYKDGFQNRYFVLETFEAGRDMLQDYAMKAKLPQELQGSSTLA
ncbi:hypothetical protein CEUSTIGMA_g3346.t1 [Chlamydomonas eustigma]|uniref:phenylalanine 4-monooxygenase n=1 Tax=Chlamydomonas eustigma TaxID=1157962 RepID=A0A250WYI1_9CHLO|nr:hypothetical protein CEUSTIGMA_g3346.t1 [Chlamydomonas eustigma]|eukprot:GAX75903.1 hypothetical protein CEUSTIGMA_g3346.t1 [Chlamydomonas eustigma]